MLFKLINIMLHISEFMPISIVGVEEAAEPQVTFVTSSTSNFVTDPPSTQLSRAQEHDSTGEVSLKGCIDGERVIGIEKFPTPNIDFRVKKT